MITVRIIEGLDYKESVPEDRPLHHAITCEIASRLQQLDELQTGNESLAPAGVRLLHRLSTLERRSRRAYRLLLDMLGKQLSFSESYDTLASRHKNSKLESKTRQSWLQNAQSDIEIITEVWPEVGEVMRELLKRRGIEE
tara:strand:+ start:717 stop:1136 length:420 start_codon:yes stop_codon:yes gene_type:complete